MAFDDAKFDKINFAELDLRFGLSEPSLEQLKTAWTECAGEAIEVHYIGNELYALGREQAVQKIAAHYLTARVEVSDKPETWLLILNPQREATRQKIKQEILAKFFPGDVWVNSHEQLLETLAELWETSPELASRVSEGVAKVVQAKQAPEPFDRQQFDRFYDRQDCEATCVRLRELLSFTTDTAERERLQAQLDVAAQALAAFFRDKALDAFRQR